MLSRSKWGWLLSLLKIGQLVKLTFHLNMYHAP